MRHPFRARLSALLFTAALLAGFCVSYAVPAMQRVDDAFYMVSPPSISPSTMRRPSRRRRASTSRSGGEASTSTAP